MATLPIWRQDQRLLYSALAILACLFVSACAATSDRPAAHLQTSSFNEQSHNQQDDCGNHMPGVKLDVELKADVVVETSYFRMPAELPFLVELGPGQKIWEWGLWTIAVEAVYADSVKVTPKEAFLLFDYMNMETFTPRGSRYIYQGRDSNEFVATAPADRAAMWATWKFEIPACTKELRVFYRVRYADETISDELYELIATSTNP